MSVCLILSLSVNHAAVADSGKCAEKAAAIKNFTFHQTPKAVSPESFLALDGTETTLGDFKGKAVLLNHWAVWCGPCIREMPSILRLSKKTQDQDIAVLPLSMDRSGRQKVSGFVLRKKWPTTAFYIDQKMKIARGSSISGIPVTQILNKDGLEVGRLVGTYEWDAGEVVEFLSCLAQ